MCVASRIPQNSAGHGIHSNSPKYGYSLILGKKEGLGMMKCWCLGVGSLLSLGVSSVGKGTIQYPGPTTASQPIFQAQWERVRCEDSEARAECGGDTEGCQRHS